VVCLLNSHKLNEQPKEHKANEAQSIKKEARSAENICAMRRLLKIKTDKMTFHQISRHFVSASYKKVAWVVDASRE